MKKILYTLLVILQLCNYRAVFAEQKIIMNEEQIIKLAGNFVENGNFENAEQILINLKNLKKKELEIERWFLLGQISAYRGDLETAIKIYRKLLDQNPNLSRIRFELAICYMKNKQWYRADYHLRLSMADDNLTTDVKKIMNYYRQIIRLNKNWNFWFNFGIAPDNNINTANGGEECVNTSFGIFCRQLPKPEYAFGLNFQIGANYEFKITDKIRIKSDTNIYTNIYNKHKFDNLNYSFSTGPRYIGDDFDIWISGTFSKNWTDWEEYNFSKGVKINFNYDFTRKLSNSLYVHFNRNNYYEYENILNGNTYGLTNVISYSIDSSKYLSLKLGLDREYTIDPVYSNYKPLLSIGFGAELPHGFNIYIEPSIYWSFYDKERFYVKNGKFRKIKERNFSQKYLLNVSNNKFDIFGFVPSVGIEYIKRTSNIWQKEFDKISFEFTLKQKF